MFQTSTRGIGLPLRVGFEASLACSKRPTGVEYYARSVMEALARVPDSGLEYHAYVPPKSDIDARLRARFRIHERPDVNTLVKTPWLVARTWLDQLDFIVTFGHVLPSYVRGRRVIMIHDTIFRDFPECYPPGTADQVHRELLSALSSVAAVIVNSQTTADEVRRHYQPAVPILVLGGAARPEFSPGEPQPFVGRLSDIRRPFFLGVGRFDRRKNLHSTVRAYRHLLTRGAECDLVLVGPADSASVELQALLGESQPGECIVCPGYITEAELINLYRAALAFVYPSLAEGFGLPVLEAMASGTPVITSNRSSMLEIARGSQALLVNPECVQELCAAMHLLYSNPERRALLAEDGVVHARRYTWEKSALHLRDGLRQLSR